MENIKNSNYEICPKCGEQAKLLPLTRKIDKKKKTVIVTYECPNGHSFTITKNII